MEYTVQLVGTDSKVKKLEAQTATEAAEKYSGQVALPTSGWLLVRGKDETVEQFQILDSMIGEPSAKKGGKKSASPEVDTDVSGSALAAVFGVLGGLELLASVVLFFMGNIKFAVVSIASGLILLALAKVIECLHEGVARLTGIQRLLIIQNKKTDAPDKGGPNGMG